MQMLPLVLVRLPRCHLYTAVQKDSMAWMYVLLYSLQEHSLLELKSLPVKEAYLELVESS